MTGHYYKSKREDVLDGIDRINWVDVVIKAAFVAVVLPLFLVLLIIVWATLAALINAALTGELILVLK